MELLDRLLGRRRRLSEENKAKLEPLAGSFGPVVWKLVELLLESGIVQQAVVAIIEALLKKFITSNVVAGRTVYDRDVEGLEAFVNELEAKLEQE